MALPKPHRSQALRQLQAFIDQSGVDYARFRNYDPGPNKPAHVSRLSPYLRYRLLTEQELLSAVLERHDPVKADKFVQEVFWRTYFKGWLEQHPTVWTDYRQAVESLVVQFEVDSGLKQRYDIAVSGSTGITCFDEWVNELTETGYLHNHARMWFASIWVFTLALPWQLGADFFYRHLLDGDPASNTLSWRWVSGLHTKGKVYRARADNIAKFSCGRFNPAGQLAAQADAITEDNDVSSAALPGYGSQRIAEPCGLLLTLEDCHPESLALNTHPAAIAAVTAENRSPLEISTIVKSFSTGAVVDALGRAERLFGMRGQSMTMPAWPKALADWAEDAGLATVVTAHVPVGPCRSQLASAKKLLREKGIELVLLLREFDQLAWPYADRGYFKLKKKIPNLLRRLELG